MTPVLKAAVFSDTHSNTALMLEAIRRYRPDVVIHLGDYERDAAVIRREFPEVALYNVCGNCDMVPTAPADDLVPLGPVKALITHGHLYDVDWGDYSRLGYAALERGASIAMFGHTHRALNEDFGSVKLLNPGSAGRGREPTWAKVEVYENGAVSTQIAPL
ncbi:MAG: metallophosphoesterase family protein [Oscillospiraceae bacterium]|nr:metallophosphoesterase family protein [Oscillospiraceae bacterium]